MRTVVIGDVHGCLDELQRLVEKCGVAHGDRVVLVGDLVAKGPDSQGVVQFLRESGYLAVLGNHDAHVLRLRSEGPGKKKPPKPEHEQVLRTLTPEDWAYLEALPLYRELPEHDAVVVHGGLVPGVPLDQQQREHLITMRSLTADGEPSKRIEDGVPWASVWPGPAHAVFGHDAVRGLQQYRFATGLDTGCVYGGKLTALSFPERTLTSVDAKRAYTPMKE